jgi:glutamate/tyrosine decarboxylase-like PLP-dependent enzyme
MTMDAAATLARLVELRAHDAPTHGGHLLSYVYDSGRPELDELAAAAIRAMQPVNGLDPTAFSSVAVIERELLDFAREVFHAGSDVAGTATSGGTESCLLAVKTARDAWRARGGSGRPRLVAPTTVHAAFRKAAALLDLELDLVPVDPASGRVAVAAMAARFGPEVALVVVSAPCYPFAALDPVVEVAEAAQRAGVDLHVDACIGGFALAFWPPSASAAPEGAWDFAVPGVTSLSADLHKYGYAPKGISVLLQRGFDRQRHQWFATSSWPGYPVVNSTLLGSKSAGPLAAAWAIASVLGVDGFRELTASMAATTARLGAAVGAIDGLAVVGDPTGPMLALAADATDPARQVDPHLWADAMSSHGFAVQGQPASIQPDGTVLPATAHLTITPVTAHVVEELVAAMAAAADSVRGRPKLDGAAIAAGLLGGSDPAGLAELDADAAYAVLSRSGLLERGALRAMAPVLALVEALPASAVEKLLVELLASALDRTGSGGVEAGPQAG